MTITKISWTQKGIQVEAKVMDKTVSFSAKKPTEINESFTYNWVKVRTFIEATQLGHQDNIQLTTVNIKESKKGTTVSLSGVAKVWIAESASNTTFTVNGIDADVIEGLPDLLNAALDWMNGIKDQLDLFANLELSEQEEPVMAEVDYNGPDETERVQEIRRKRSQT